MSKRHIHDELICAMAAKGATLAEIAHAIGRTKPVAHAHLKRLGITYAREKVGRKPGGIHDGRLRDLAVRGATVLDLMRATGMCRGGVYGAMDRLGIARPHRAPSARQLAIIEARRQGKTYSEIGCDFGVSRCAAFRAVKRWSNEEPNP